MAPWWDAAEPAPAPVCVVLSKSRSVGAYNTEWLYDLAPAGPQTGRGLFSSNAGAAGPKSDMQKPRPALVRVTAPIVMTAVMLLSVRSAHAEVTLGDLMRKCLLLENYWALKSTEDTTSSIPNDGSAVCFGYLLAFRGLQGAVIGTDCASTQRCRRTLRFCIAEQTPDERILSAFIAYAGGHAGQWHEGAASYYLNAMHEAFPCTDDRK